MIVDADTAAVRPADAPPGIYGPDGRAQFFNDPAVDRFVASLLNLASEVWIQKEHIMALQAQLTASSSGAASAEGAVDRDAELKGFIDRVFAPLRERAPGPDDFAHP